MTRPGLVASLGRWICTKNPFYVISAALVFAGLRMSFGPEAQSNHPSGLAIGLIGYSLLLAAASYLLVHFARVWDDVRSVLLIMVLIMVTLSESVDEILVENFTHGAIMQCADLAFAVLMSEALLRALHIRLSWLYRGPYYALLMILYGYPVFIVAQHFAHGSTELHQALLGFNVLIAAAVIALTPAASRGDKLTVDSGTPWRWPWFPWPMFVAVGLFAGWRSYTLCVSLDPVSGATHIFGAYFLVLPLLAVAWVVLEAALHAQSRWGTLASLGLAGGTILLAHKQAGSAMYARFLDELTVAMHASPLFIAVALVTLFCCYATVRRVRVAPSAGSLCLVLLSTISPATQSLQDVAAPTAWVLALPASVQLVLAVERKSSLNALAAMGLGLAYCYFRFDLLRAWPLLAHAQVVLLGTLLVAALFADEFARFVRRLGVIALAFNLLCLAQPGAYPSDWAPWGESALPAAWVVFAVIYGRQLHASWYLALALVAGSLWSTVHVIRWYRELRLHVPGLDLLTAGITALVVALAVSFAKAGLSMQRLALRLLRR